MHLAVPAPGVHQPGVLTRALHDLHQRRTNPGAGFALRCSQRLSVPRAAARPWDWRPNRCTVASSPPVLAYWGGIP